MCPRMRSDAIGDGAENLTRLLIFLIPFMVRGKRPDLSSHNPWSILKTRIREDEEKTMKTLIARFLTLCVLSGIVGSAIADETARVVWTCAVNQGKTLDDVRKANSAWVEFMRKNVDEAISSTILAPVIGNLEGGRFVFADDFPNFDVWNKARMASLTDEGQAIDAAINEAATCTSSSLYTAEES